VGVAEGTFSNSSAEVKEFAFFYFFLQVFFDKPNN
jgi:hypothetical protein